MSAILRLFSRFRPAQGGVYDAGYAIQTYGISTQFNVLRGGLFVGTQCTTMALVAAIYWRTVLRSGERHFTPDSIESILSYGDRLHKYLRNTLKLSRHYDRRIAIDDLPCREYISMLMYDRQLDVKLKEIGDYVWLGPAFLNNPLKSFSDYINDSNKEDDIPRAYLITIGDSSYSIIKQAPDCFIMFDSHGSFSHDGLKQRASVLQFSSFEDLKAFITKTHDNAETCLIAEVDVQEMSREGDRLHKNKKPVNLDKRAPRHVYVPLPFEPNLPLRGAKPIKPPVVNPAEVSMEVLTKTGSLEEDGATEGATASTSLEPPVVRKKSPVLRKPVPKPEPIDISKLPRIEPQDDYDSPFIAMMGYRC